MRRLEHITIDLRAIPAMHHRCSGCHGAHACCCAKYEIAISAREMRRIIGVLPLAAKFCPWLKRRNGFENVFDEAEAGRFVIDTHENGLCVFAYSCSAGIRCSLHSVAEQMKTAPHLVKPFSCTLWPLSLLDPPHARLSICSEAVQFPCNRRRRKKGGSISPDLLDTIEGLLGTEARDRVVEAARKGLSAVRVAVNGPLAEAL